MSNSDSRVKARLGRAMALFVSMPVIAGPAMSGELNIRAGERQGRTVDARGSGRISARTLTTGRVGIRINQPSLDKTLVDKTIVTGVRAIGK